ncbi:MAG: TetR/AcrR family transcriptional regulator, partial [Promicromonosporaceae bacterium]|nr:TetR/AcrR family transcriptional regulator [Promicromonosporaceae bacterium]
FRELADEFRELKEELGATGREVRSDLREAGREIADAGREVRDELFGTPPDAPEKRTTRQAKADQTRADLMDAAARVFAEKGYEAASVNDLAKAAGYTKGALYAHFASKEELFLAVIQAASNVEGLMEGMDACAAPTELTAPAIGSADQLPSLLLSLEAYLHALRHPESRELLTRIAERQFTELGRQVRFARTGEGGEPGQDDRDVAMALAAIYTMGGVFSQVVGPEWNLEASAERIADRLLGLPG